MEWIPIVGFFLIVIPCMLFIILKPMIDNKKSANGVINTDIHSRNFVFKVERSQLAIRNLLLIRNEDDVMVSSFDKETDILTFFDEYVKLDYRVQISEKEDCCIVRLSQISHLAQTRNIPYYVNSFIIKKLSAVPVPYFEESTDVT